MVHGNIFRLGEIGKERKREKKKTSKGKKRRNLLRTLFSIILNSAAEIF